ncbi:O(6)-methylguanine-induced apoptosis 2 [Megalops cyprinoides]|uniref:O(6)-methylguanine-induced apoptosis 2 n=1 Tax=Megalops cyprinoides TaxID=118141 RepID=UPI0018651F2B|nr:O(6)-methylguanine-induced apoptosis 2 [Megalops cyprinoides]
MATVLHPASSLPQNTSSIPTKYRTEVIRNEEKRGFSTQTRRFCSGDSLNENPGPGAYMSHSSADITSPSFSKRGTGGLASKAVRSPPLPWWHTPAPNAYSLPCSLLQKHSFSWAGTSAFHPPIAVATGSFKNKTPAPNHYQVNFSGVEKNTAVSAQSVFLSRTGRSAPHPGTSGGPSPCQYRVSDSITRPAPRVPLSCFKSRSTRTLSLVKSQVPGPAAYSPHKAPEPPRRTALPKGHYLSISAPAIPLPKTPPLPGPGQYNITNYDALPKQHMSSAVFMSGTSRWIRAVPGQDLPGPGFYDPEKSQKRSFLYNHSNRWVPA